MPAATSAPAPLVPIHDLPLPMQDTAGPTTRLKQKAENLTSEHLTFLDALIKHINFMPEEAITTIFLEPLISYDQDKKQFVEHHHLATSHNIHALDRLIKLDQKEKSGLFASVGKQFFTQLGKAAKLITPKNKD